MQGLQAGSKAPDFKAINQNGKEIKLADLLGKTVILYFYPKDGTPGCTVEACSFRDGMPELEQEGVKVIGVSADNSESHKKFEKKHGLNFTLLEDRDKKIMTAYGVAGSFGTARRVTYLIDREGVIRYVWSKVSPRGHSAEVLKKVKELTI